MKKLVSVKEIMIILISLLLIILSTEVFAAQTDLNLVLVGQDNGAQTVSPDDYADAQTPEVENKANNTPTTPANNTVNNSINNKTNNTVNNTKVYNTNKTTDLPQTGIEDYNIGILLIICIASAIFAYRKINEYKNI